MTARALVCVCAAAVVAACAGCGGSSSSSSGSSTSGGSAPAGSTNAGTTTAPPPPAPTSATETTGSGVTPRFPYPQPLVRSYMRSCIRSARQSSGRPRPVVTGYCRCTLSRLENTVPALQLTKFGLAIAHGRAPKGPVRTKVLAAVRACRGQLHG